MKIPLDLPLLDVIKSYKFIDFAYIKKKIKEKKKENSSELYFEIGNFFLNTFNPTLAIYFFKKSLEIKFTDICFTTILQTISLFSDEKKIPERKMIDTMRSVIKYKYKNEYRYKKLKKKNKYNVGFISHFFDSSTSELLIKNLIINLGETFNYYFYSDQKKETITEKVSKLKNFKSVDYLNDDELYELIKKDDIDVLIECNGWTLPNRFGILERRAAPIQATYYNIASTSGINNCDCIILSTDNVTSKIKNYISEKIYKFDNGIIPYSNSLDTKININPFEKNDEIIFCCFGASHKLNLNILEIWSEILKRTKNTKILIKNNSLNILDYKTAYKKILSNFFDMERVILEGPSEYKQLLENYNKCHINLDTYPHVSGTTASDATYMGVPTITWVGQRICSQNINIMSFKDENLIAYNKDEYINKAIKLSKNKKLIKQYKRDLRQKILNRQDPKLITKNFENGLTELIKDQLETTEKLNNHN